MVRSSPGQVEDGGAAQSAADAYRLLVETFAQAVWETNAQGLAVTDSPSWRAYTGQTTESWLSEGWVRAVHPDERAQARALWQEAIRQQAPVNAEFRLASAGGGWRWTNILATAVRNPDGSVQKWVGATFDNTTRKQTEAEVLRLKDELAQRATDRYQALYNAIDEGFCVVQLLYDESGQPLDFRYLDINPAFEKQTGILDPVGKTFRSLVAEPDSELLDRYAEVDRTGQPQRFMIEVSLTGRWYDLYAARIGQPEEHQLTVLFTDITERKQTEARLRLSEARQAYLLQLSDALRKLSDLGAIQQTACRVLGQALGASRVLYGEVTPDAAHLLVEQNYVTVGQPVLTGQFRLANFGQKLLTELAAGRTVALPDITQATELSEAEKASYGALGVAALLGVPLLKDERLVGTLVMHQATPRLWSQEEKALLEATAERIWGDVERARAEKALRERELAFRTTANAGPALVWICTPAGENLFFNDRWYEYTGLSRSEAKDHGWSLVTHPDDWALLAPYWERCQRTGEPYSGEVRYRRRDGQYRWHVFRALPRRNAQDQIEAWYGLSVDVHDAREAQDALRRSQAHLAAIFQEAQVGISELDRKGNFIRVNDKLCQLLGREPADVLRLSVLAVTHPDDVLPSQEAFQRVLRTGRSVSLDKRYVRPSGEAVWANSTLSLLSTETDEPPTVLAITVDLTERRQAELALQEADRRKDEFLALLAHELRNPMATLSNTVQILELTGGGSPVMPLESAVQLMSREIRQLVRLVDDLLDVSRITRGRTELRLCPLDLTQLVQEVVEGARQLVEMEGRQLEVCLPEESLRLQGDAARLTQVIRNLLGNAVKFTRPDGRINLRLEREGNRAVLRVQDNGIGIPPEYLDQIFTMFFQVDSSRTRSKGGLGLGLTLVREFVGQHGGSIEAYSAGPDQGSEFVVYLPLLNEP